MAKRAKRFLVVLAGAATLLLAPLASSAADKPDHQAAVKGRLIYERYCASCHGREARGDGPLAPDLRVRPTDLTRLAARNQGRFPFSEVVAAIDGRKETRGHGPADMPVWGEIFPKTKGTESPTVESAVSRIGHYLWSLQVGD